MLVFFVAAAVLGWGGGSGGGSSWQWEEALDVLGSDIVGGCRSMFACGLFLALDIGDETFLFAWLHWVFDSVDVEILVLKLELSITTTCSGKDKGTLSLSDKRSVFAKFTCSRV